MEKEGIHTQIVRENYIKYFNTLDLKKQKGLPWLLCRSLRK